MMDYLTIDQTMQYLQGRMPAPFDYPQLAQLCRNRSITVVIAYDGYIRLVNFDDLEKYQDILFSGYLYSPLLISAITSNEPVEIDEAVIYEAPFYEENENITYKTVDFVDYTDCENLDEAICAVSFNRDELLFSRYQVENIPTETSVTNKILHIAQWGQDEKIGIMKDLLPPEQDKTINKLQATIDQQAKEIAELKVQLASIEQAGKDTQSDTPADNKELSPVSQKAVTRLIYALLSEHGYELDGKRKGATNDQLVTLTKSHKVEIHRDTIATWLDRANALKFDLRK